MKLVTVYSDSHCQMLVKYFMRSATKFFESITAIKIPQFGEGTYGKLGWSQAVLQKVRAIHEFGLANQNGQICYADADVVFVKDPVEDMSERLKTNLIVAQKDRRQYCSGFFAINCNSEGLQFLSDWLVLKSDLNKTHDQPLFNQVINELPPKTPAFGLDEEEYWTPGNKGNGDWSMLGENELALPPVNAKVIHANWIHGVLRKERFMEAIGQF